VVSKREKSDKDSQAALVKKRASVKSASKNREKLHGDLANKKSGGKLDPGLYCFKTTTPSTNNKAINDK